MGVLRMEGEDTDTGIRVAIGPGMGNGGVVDRQDLEHALFGGCYPVDHFLQVTEVAHAKAFSASEGEHGNQCSGAFHVIDGEESLWQLIHHDIAFVQQGQTDAAVTPFLPNWGHIILFIEDDEFELHDGTFQLGGIYVHHPLVITVFRHGECILGIPIPQCRSVTQ